MSVPGARGASNLIGANVPGGWGLVGCVTFALRQVKELGEGEVSPLGDPAETQDRKRELQSAVDVGLSSMSVVTNTCSHNVLTYSSCKIVRP